MKFLLILLVRVYQVFISPPLHFLSGPLGGCRYHPTCSQYFIDAVRVHGSVRGAWMGLARIFRCHPWGGLGYDPVPGWEEFVASDPSGRRLLESRSRPIPNRPAHCSGQTPETTKGIDS